MSPGSSGLRPMWQWFLEIRKMLRIRHWFSHRHLQTWLPKYHWGFKENRVGGGGEFLLWNLHTNWNQAGNLRKPPYFWTWVVHICFLILIRFLKLHNITQTLQESLMIFSWSFKSKVTWLSCSKDSCQQFTITIKE